MNRRRFISLLGQSVAGATVAYSFPSIIVPKNIRPVSYNELPYVVSDTAQLFPGMLTSTYRDLNAPSFELSGAVLTPQMIEYARAHLHAMFRITSESPMLSFR